MSQVLKASRTELEKAKQRLEEMKGESNPVKFESYWRDFLNYIEKSWQKSEFECDHIKNKFIPWRGSYVKARKTDPLLQYLNQARDSDNHSIQEVVVKQQDRVNIRPSKSGDLHIKQMVIVDNVLETYDGDPIDIIAVPGRIEAISVVNRGVAFTPPNAHNGQPIKRHKDPIEIAELGIEYYERYLKRIEEKFFT